MSGPKRGLRERRAMARRERMLDAAAAVFRRHGFHGAAMAQVAAEAGLSVGQIYRDFANKEALIAAIAERDLEVTRGTFAEMTQDPARAAETLLAGVPDGVNKMLDPLGAALALEVLAEAARQPALTATLQREYQEVRTYVGWFFAAIPRPAGAFTTAEAVDLATLVFTGLSVRAIQDPAVDAAALTSTISRFLAELAGLPAPDPAPKSPPGDSPPSAPPEQPLDLRQP